MDFWEIGICEMQSFVWDNNICAYGKEKKRWIDVDDDGDGKGEALNKWYVKYCVPVIGSNGISNITKIQKDVFIVTILNTVTVFQKLTASILW